MDGDFKERRINGSLEVRVARLEERAAAAAEALRIASSNIDGRLGLMNELREQINQERGHYLSREEYEMKHELITKSIQTLQQFQWTITGGLIVFQILIAALLHYWRG